VATSNPCALRLIQEPHENEWLEFKVNNADPHELGEYVSALANAAMMSNKDRAFLVLGVDDKTRRKLGTSVRLNKLKRGGENFTNWLCRLTEPRLMIEFLDFDCEGLNFSILVIEPSYDRPVRFDGVEYIRIGENKKKLIEFPHHERTLWMLTGRRKFEAAIATTNQTPEQVLEKLSTDTFYTLSGEPKPKSPAQTIRRLEGLGAIKDNLEGALALIIATLHLVHGLYKTLISRILGCCFRQ
jgi:ATP-dependent DNA helicase RecG